MINKRPSPDPLLFNLLWFNAMWLSCVWAQDRAALWVVPMIAAHLYRHRRETLLVGGCALLGLAVEWFFLHSGALQGAGSWPPLWMVLLWAAFATTLNHSLRWFQRHLCWAALAGGAGGLAAYLGGTQLSGVALGEPRLGAMVLIGVTWALLMPLLAWVSLWLDRAPTASAGPPG